MKNLTRKIGKERKYYLLAQGEVIIIAMCQIVIIAQGEVIIIAMCQIVIIVFVLIFYNKYMGYMIYLLG